MIMDCNAGIVIKSYLPFKNKIVILDRHLGMIDGIVLRGDFMIGSLISYQLTQQANNFYCLRDVILEEVPFDLACHDILFLHHLVELCYYFIPIGSEIDGVFSLLQCLYLIDKNYWNSATQKLFLFRMLVLIGFYSQQVLLDEKIVKQLLEEPLDNDVTIDLAKQHECLLGGWLLHCVSNHPYVQKFNTVHFLTRDLKI